MQNTIFQAGKQILNKKDFAFILADPPNPNDDSVEGNFPFKAVDGNMIDGELEGNDLSTRLDGDDPTGPPDFLDFMDGNL